MAAPRDDMRDDRHPAHDKYRQAYAGVEKIDRALGRESDGNIERLAAALSAAGATMPAISPVVLSRAGTRAFAVHHPHHAKHRSQAMHGDDNGSAQLTRADPNP